jgi:hypothetical protein
MQREWQDIWVEHLRALLDDGKSASEIAESLSYRYREKFSRNAVIGKTHRLGIHCKGATGRAPKPKAEPKPKPERAPRSRKPQAPTIIEFPFELDHPGITLMELERGLCAWPIGEQPWRYCGLPCLDGSYCPGHAAMAYEQRPRSRRAYLFLEGGRHGRRG